MQLHLQKRLEQLQDIDLPFDVSCLQNHELRVEVKDGKTLKLTVSSPVSLPGTYLVFIIAASRQFACIVAYLTRQMRPCSSYVMVLSALGSGQFSLSDALVAQRWTG